MSASSEAGPGGQADLLVPSVPQPAPKVDGPGRTSPIWTWIGVLPFFIFALLFLILPTGFLMVGAFQDAQGHFTFANMRELFQEGTMDAYWISFKVSAASAIGGAVLGSLLAWAAVHGKLPGWIRPTLLTFSGVASNFAGVPLAFAFICTLGRVGLVTVLLKKYADINLYSTGFSILSFWGLTITYLYFQIPLMVLIITPALDGLKREWREACDCLGGTAYQYWRHVALPVLWPSVLGATLLLFANSFGAVATAYALTGSSLNIVTILLYAQIRGDVLHNQNLGYALALGMILVTGLSNGGYIWLRSRVERGRR
ncbi:MULTISPECIES: ABC transporter permease subunit [Paraburkholderia]|jgi:putative spermidine/putrescine transport system permease protein|uniref:ABC transporter n=1 Tax=Paraburkholderia largidicola TaxID=3014751 RepID=A0A7I8BFK4_9BURK|nr:MULTISPECIES: ABC transporter permease subunit [Paraburkholderia]BEU20120.1 ABC transporter permease subunit [Paraburkholderia sp. 22B1P]GJH34321.1 ABC transporter permease subunit [Paraburkholderia hospita]CAG9245726.1 ABC transporter permease protein [Paraburkholderia caribensis]BCF87213.1 ABC transporter [Paraburkholderia sp. PGU16]GJG99286.1 ABC transporter permease subunit [Paraburkholderia terrae]